MDDQLIKLNKCIDVMPSKKQQQRMEMLANERSSGSVLKIGSVMHRNPAEFGSQKFDDRPKNGLNKRLRTSVAETRVCSCSYFSDVFNICCFSIEIKSASCNFPFESDFSCVLGLPISLSPLSAK